MDINFWKFSSALQSHEKQFLFWNCPYYICFFSTNFKFLKGLYTSISATTASLNSFHVAPKAVIVASKISTWKNLDGRDRKLYSTYIICFDSQISWIMNGYFHGGSNILLPSSTEIAKNFFKIPGYCLIFGNIIHHYIYVSSAVILRFNLKIVLLCILVFTLLFEYNYTRIHENKTYLPVSDVFLVLLCEYITSTVSWSFFM